MKRKLYKEIKERYAKLRKEELRQFPKGNDAVRHVNLEIIRGEFDLTREQLNEFMVKRTREYKWEHMFIKVQNLVTEGVDVIFRYFWIIPTLVGIVSISWWIGARMELSVHSAGGILGIVFIATVISVNAYLQRIKDEA